jgi:hypothetical protein
VIKECEVAQELSFEQRLKIYFGTISLVYYIKKIIPDQVKSYTLDPVFTDEILYSFHSVNLIQKLMAPKRVLTYLASIPLGSFCVISRSVSIDRNIFSSVNILSQHDYDCDEISTLLFATILEYFSFAVCYYKKIDLLNSSIETRSKKESECNESDSQLKSDTNDVLSEFNYTSDDFQNRLSSLELFKERVKHILENENTIKTIRKELLLKKPIRQTIKFFVMFTIIINIVLNKSSIIQRNLKLIPFLANINFGIGNLIIISFCITLIITLVTFFAFLIYGRVKHKRLLKDLSYFRTECI